MPKTADDEALTNFILPVDLSDFNDDGDVKAQLAMPVMA